MHVVKATIDDGASSYGTEKIAIEGLAQGPYTLNIWPKLHYVVASRPTVIIQQLINPKQS